MGSEIVLYIWLGFSSYAASENAGTSIEKPAVIIIVGCSSLFGFKDCNFKVI